MRNRAWIVLAFCLAFACSTSAQSPRRYPNELAKYPFYASDPWRQIVPLVSTRADVRRLLGDPAEATDMAEYGKPYPGDKKAKRPLFTYRWEHWEVLIYYVDTYLEDGKYPPALHDRVLSVDFISEDPLPFSRIKLPKAFKKTDVMGADAAWNEFADGTGLKYEIYTGLTPYGHTKPGDLNRISYGASPGELARASVTVGR